MSASAGRQLSNIAYNWSQNVGKVLDARDCKLLRELADLFDAEHFAAQSPSQPLVEVQEPVGYQMRRYYRDVGDTGWGIWHSINKDEYDFCVGRKDEDVETRLVYAAAPVRGLPLTEGQIEDFAKEIPWMGFRKDANDEYTIPVISGSVMKLIRKVEAAHGISSSAPGGDELRGGENV